MAKRLLVAYSTVLQHFHKSLGLKWFHLRSIPCLLRGDLREKRKRCAKMILPFLPVAEWDGWHHLVTRDES
jgi:hypothetical protein